MESGFKFFKMKIGNNIEDDARRMKLFRKIIGYDVPLVSFTTFSLKIIKHSFFMFADSRTK